MQEHPDDHACCRLNQHQRSRVSVRRDVQHRERGGGGDAKKHNRREAGEDRGTPGVRSGNEDEKRQRECARDEEPAMDGPEPQLATRSGVMPGTG